MADKWSAIVLALLLTLVAAGCSEAVRIKSYPSGAAAYLDGEFIGTTPVNYSVPRSGVRSGRRWKVEYGNCDSAEGTLATAVGGGRVTGYIFTLGFTALFKGPRGFRPVDAQLTGGDCIAGGAATAATQRSGVFVTQIVGDSNSSGSDGSTKEAHQRISDRLLTLRDLYRRKLITEGEYEKERARAIRDLEQME